MSRPEKKTVSLPLQTALEPWVKTEHHCPACGEQNVWRMEVQAGVSMAKHLCAASDCKARFLMSVSVEQDDTERHAARLEAIGAGGTNDAS